MNRSGTHGGWRGWRRLSGGLTALVVVLLAGPPAVMSAGGGAAALAATPCPPGSAYSNLVAGTSGLISYWRLGESSGTSACDSKGSNVGSYQGGFTLGAAGALVGDSNRAVRLNGSTGYVSVPASSSLNVGDTFTIEAWVKRASTGGTQVIASKQTGAWLLMFDTGNRLVLRRSTVADVAASTATVSDTSRWHYVAATKSGSVVHLYIDGFDVTGPVSNQTLANNTSPLVIGRSSGINSFNGTTDEVALYGTALSADQVAKHYTTGALPPAQASSDPVIGAAGDTACPTTNPSYNGGVGTTSLCRQKYTSDLLVGRGLTAVLPLGDNQYEVGALAQYRAVYDRTWGRAKSISRPVSGNHEYMTSGASGYFDYFNGVGNQTGPAGLRGQGYYSFDVGAWHVIALNSECSQVGGCGANSAQELWLRLDLAAHSTARCTLAFWHRPLFTSEVVQAPETRPLWNDLYNAGAEVVLNGHAHNYERFAPQTPTGQVDTARGIREFIAGTGGDHLTTFTRALPNSEVRNDSTYGVLRLTLHAGSYDWRFTPAAPSTFTDSGTTACH